MTKTMKTSAWIAVVAAATALSSCGGGQQQQQMPAPEIEVMTVTPTDATIDNTFPATIKGKTDIDIRPQISGFITRVWVDEGQHVKKGQTLFSIDAVQYQAAVDQARAAVNAAQTAVQTAKITVDSKKALLDKNIISQYEYQLADNQLQSARAQLAQAKANLASAQKNLSYTNVVAPSDGVVGAIPNREGSLASPTSAVPLTTVSDNSQMYAYFALNEKDILAMTEGGKSLSQAIASMPPVKLVLADGTEYPLEGKVATVAGVVDTQTGSSNVRALFQNPNGVLRSGSTGNIVIPVSQQSVITIPQRATSELQDKKYVYVLGDSNIVHQTEVRVQDMNDGRSYVVTEGLKPGEVIAVEGVGMTVKDRTPITPKAAGAAQPQQAQQQPQAQK